MSYEPTLIISKTDLHTNSGVIEKHSWREPPKRQSEKDRRRHEAYKWLERLLAYEGVKICGATLVITNPETAQLNRDMRELLHELNIEFAVYD